MRITHRLLLFRWFVGLLTYPFTCRGFSPLHKRIASAFSLGHDSPSNDRFSPRADFSARKTMLWKYSYFRDSAPFLCTPQFCRLRSIRTDSFRVRGSHPIPLFSEQACVSESVIPSGRAFATKAMLFICIYVRLFSAHKKTSPARLSAKQKKS